ncbi:hypothetical protein NDU88_001724 [Pleurodeles waltl]|uniref:Uncharacterized protein n=1 Tax=Pleurodeles waltl TaxID=8319 RepID=A0AAV7KU54_PLEWA|nr:hypothetical protein NDU88_001724 [Pleurodeles waltl]
MLAASPRCSGGNCGAARGVEPASLRRGMLPAATLRGTGLRFPPGAWRASVASLIGVLWGAISAVVSCRGPPPSPPQLRAFSRHAWGSRPCLEDLDRVAWRSDGHVDSSGRWVAREPLLPGRTGGIGGRLWRGVSLESGGFRGVDRRSRQTAEGGPPLLLNGLAWPGGRLPVLDLI